jgi:kynurenine aminotransferase
MAGGRVVYVPLRPPADSEAKNTAAADWAFDIEELRNAMTERTKMIVRKFFCTENHDSANI